MSCILEILVKSNEIYPVRRASTITSGDQFVTMGVDDYAKLVAGGIALSKGKGA